MYKWMWWTNKKVLHEIFVYHRLVISLHNPGQELNPTLIPTQKLLSISYRLISYNWTTAIFHIFELTNTLSLVLKHQCQLVYQLYYKYACFNIKVTVSSYCHLIIFVTRKPHIHWVFLLTCFWHYIIVCRIYALGNKYFVYSKRAAITKDK